MIDHDAGRTHGRLGGDNGAALVEFALVFPLLVIFLMGIFSGGLVMNNRISLTTAAREGARYGATVPLSQCAGGACGTSNWAGVVRSLTVERSVGSVTAAGVCVALVQGPGTAPVAVSAGHTTAGGTNPCFVDNSADTGRRVQVSITRPDQIDAALFTVPVSLSARSVSRFEQ